MSQKAMQDRQNELEMKRVLKERREKSMEALLLAHQHDLEMKKQIAESRFMSKIQRVTDIQTEQEKAKQLALDIRIQMQLKKVDLKKQIQNMH